MGGAASFRLYEPAGAIRDACVLQLLYGFVGDPNSAAIEAGKDKSVETLAVCPAGVRQQADRDRLSEL
jgi:hypothetical protein